MPTATKAQLTRRLEEVEDDLTRERWSNELLQESVADLERQLLDPGWIRLVAESEIEFSAEGLRRLRAICRLYTLKNALVKRGMGLRVAYIWGQGVEIQARADGHDTAQQDVNTVIQGFLDDRANKRALFGALAREQLEKALGHDGELYLALFTKPRTGTVQARVILADEIADIISNPDDSSDPWYYKRQWEQSTVNLGTGVPTQRTMTTYYPAVGYRPTVMPPRIGGDPVRWDAPIMHVAVNVPLGWRRGVPDSYAAVDWARAHKEFLEDWARLVKSLSRFAWRLTAKGQQAAQAKTRLATAPSVDPVTRQPLSAGGTAIVSPDAQLEAIPKTGATIDAESGRPLAMMVAAALGVPVTMLLADPGQTGARATAETLDQPTQLEMQQRQAVWAEAYTAIFDHVIRASVEAPHGALKGKVGRDEWDRATVALDGDTPTTVDITWPEVSKVAPDLLIDAIVKADATGVIRPEEVLRLLLTVLGVHNVDELVANQLDDDGNFIWPSGGPPSLGALAAAASRSGQDPAAVGSGSMAPGEPAADGEDPTSGDQPPE